MNVYVYIGTVFIACPPRQRLQDVTKTHLEIWLSPPYPPQPSPPPKHHRVLLNVYRILGFNGYPEIHTHTHTHIPRLVYKHTDTHQRIYTYLYKLHVFRYATCYRIFVHMKYARRSIVKFSVLVFRFCNMYVNNNSRLRNVREKVDDSDKHTRRQNKCICSMNVGKEFDDQRSAISRERYAWKVKTVKMGMEEKVKKKSAFGEKWKISRTPPSSSKVL